MTVLTILKGRELGWVCLGSCAADVGDLLLWCWTAAYFDQGRYQRPRIILGNRGWREQVTRNQLGPSQGPSRPWTASHDRQATRCNCTRRPRFRERDALWTTIARLWILPYDFVCWFHLPRTSSKYSARSRDPTISIQSAWNEIQVIYWFVQEGQKSNRRAWSPG